jgi:four helix bundle protein
MTPQQLEDRLIDFAARVGKVVDALPETRLGRHVAGQLVRCGTSPAPNYAEACNSESRADFVHKLMIALKELREARCWIRMVIRADLLRGESLADLLDESVQLAKILGASVATAKGAARESDATMDAPVFNS